MDAKFIMRAISGEAESWQPNTRRHLATKTRAEESVNTFKNISLKSALFSIDALYCVGGFDGQTFLNSVERYCPTDGNVWTLIPSALTVPRNNVGLVSVRFYFPVS